LRWCSSWVAGEIPADCDWTSRGHAARTHTKFCTDRTHARRMRAHSRADGGKWQLRLEVVDSHLLLADSRYLSCPFYSVNDECWHNLSESSMCESPPTRSVDSSMIESASSKSRILLSRTDSCSSNSILLPGRQCNVEASSCGSVRPFNSGLLERKCPSAFIPNPRARALAPYLKSASRLIR